MLVRPALAVRSSRSGCEQVRGDVTDRPSVRRALRGIERVFHIAGTANLGRLARPDVQAQRRGHEDRARGGAPCGVERVVLTSSAAAIGPAPPGQDRRRADGVGRGAIRDRVRRLQARGRGRGAAPAGAWPAARDRQSDLRARRRRSGRSSTTLVLRFLRRQIPAYVNGTLNIVGVDDVARGHLLADELGAGWRALHPRQPQLHDGPPVRGSRPAVGRRAAGGEAAAASRARAGRGCRPRRRAARCRRPTEVRASALNWAFNNAKAKRELDWRTSPHEDCLEETIAWYRAERGRRSARRERASRCCCGLAGGVPRRIF